LCRYAVVWSMQKLMASPALFAHKTSFAAHAPANSQ
jgi:hypothetical protein